MAFPWHQYLLAVIFVVAGISHFKYPALYKKIVPTYLPDPNSLVIVSGVLEIIAGFMLVSPGTASVGAWVMLGLLVLFIPVHVFMLKNEAASLNLPKWVLRLRLVLQIGLMYWAWEYV